jgi:F-type H+-transporting ATPase subunit gamma
METLEALESRIRSTEGLGSVVRTMKSLSAVHIRQYESAVRSLRRYDRTVELGLRALLHAHRFDGPDISLRHDSGRTAIIVFGSDYGLCGQFNADLVDDALATMGDLAPGREEPFVVSIGARASVALRARGRPPQVELAPPSSVGGIASAVRDLLVAIDGWRSREGVERVLLIRHRHESASTHRIERDQLLPVDPSRFRRSAERPWPSRRLPLFTMDPQRLLSALLRELFAVALFRAFGESGASEHASRLQAMQAAERNIDEKLQDLSADYHRRRQDAITSELLDIISGYEALG